VNIKPFLRRYIGFPIPPMCSQQTDQLIQIQQTDQLIKISQTDQPIKISPAEQLIRAQQKEQLLKGQTTKNGHGFMVVSGTSHLGKYNLCTCRITCIVKHSALFI
jgi:hypothetical protein